MAASTATIRFPGYTHPDFTSIVSSVAPIRNCHYLVAGYTPFTTDTVEKAKILRKTTVFDIMRRLLQPKNIMASFTPSRQSCFISAFNLLRGQIDPSEVYTESFHLFLNVLDPQKSFKAPRKEISQLYSLGTSWNSRRHGQSTSLCI